MAILRAVTSVLLISSTLRGELRMEYVLFLGVLWGFGCFCGLFCSCDVLYDQLKYDIYSILHNALACRRFVRLNTNLGMTEWPIA